MSSSSRIQCTRCDLVAGRDQPAQHRTLAHQLRITANVGRRRRVLRQRIQIHESARLLGAAGVAQRLEYGDRIGRLAGVNEAADRPEDVLMVLPIEIVGADQVGDAIPRGVVEQQSAEHRLLRLDRVRRQTYGRELRIDRLIHE